VHPLSGVHRITSADEARDIAHRVLTPGRLWPVVVLTIPAGHESRLEIPTDQGGDAAITVLPPSAWSPTIDADADGAVRDGAQVAELTGLLGLSGWPAGTRVIVRSQRPHAGAELTLFQEADGWRYTAFVTNRQVGAL
jgi:hypothetical protein